MVVFIFEEQIAAAIEAHKPQKELTADCADSTPSTTYNAQLQPAAPGASPSQLSRAESTRHDTDSGRRAYAARTHAGTHAVRCIPTRIHPVLVVLGKGCNR